jgi:hypothetical protein
MKTETAAIPSGAQRSPESRDANFVVAQRDLKTRPACCAGLRYGSTALEPTRRIRKSAHDILPRRSKIANA